MIEWMGFRYKDEGDLWLHATDKESAAYADYKAAEQAEKDFPKFIRSQFGVNSYEELEDWCKWAEVPYDAATVFQQFVEMRQHKRDWEDCVFN